MNDVINLPPLVDRIVETVPGVRAAGLKNVTVNEPFFAGHFPGRPIMPGVLILETMVQVAQLAFAPSPGSGRAVPVPALTAIETARFRRPVVPGDQLRVEVEVLEGGKEGIRCLALAFVGPEKCAEATFSLGLNP